MDDSAKQPPWFMHFLELVTLIGLVWIALAEGLVRAVVFVGICIVTGSLVILVWAVREAILRRYRG